MGNWRVAGPAGLYAVGGGFDPKTGRYTAAMAGVHYCYAMLRIDAADKGKLFRLSLNLNNGLDDNNGFHAVRGNKDSKNFGSSNVAGTVKLKKGDKMSVYVYAQNDDKWSVATESGFGCHRLGSNIGFHASGSQDQKFRNSYSRITAWRTKGNNELYNHGGAGIDAKGFYNVPSDGFYVCAAQVRINNAHSNGYFRLMISINGGIDSNSGFAVMDGNQGSDNYRSLRVAGTVSLKAGNTVSVMIYSQNDLDWTFSKESGFSCGKTYAKTPCAPCQIPFSNKEAGPGCACKTGYSGKITWKDDKPSGVCKPMACDVENSNKQAGPACACGNGYSGKITWKDNKPTGKCEVAKCNVENSNKKPGKDCKCTKPYTGTIRWMGPTAIGPCTGCGTNSGFNADLTKNLKGKRLWQEIGGWRTNANTELYESNSEFDKARGRFAPKATGYYLCNANIAFDFLSSSGMARLLIGVNKKGAKTTVKDYNNGLSAIEGNGGSNYRSMTVAGVLRIKEGEFASVFFYSSFDSIFTIKTESGFSCHRFGTKFGFHADKLNTETLSLKTGWVKIQNWRDSGSAGLYNLGGGYDRKTGTYKAPASGPYFCSALLRLDYASRTSMFRLSLNVDDKPEFNHGLSTVRGNKGSSNYGTMGVAGSIYLAKSATISLYAYSSNDNFFRVTTEAGWGCHMMGTGVGFHADMSVTQQFTSKNTGWARLSKWRTAGNNELYAQGGSLNSQGYFAVPEAGYYVCAAQVRIDSTSSSARYRMIIAINNEMDINNGLHVTDSNVGITNYRSLRLAGSVYLKKGDMTSVAILPPTTEKQWKVHTESGFSCHMFMTKKPCKGDDVPEPTEPIKADGNLVIPEKTTVPPEEPEPPIKPPPVADGMIRPPIADGTRPVPFPPVADGGISIGGR